MVWAVFRLPNTNMKCYRCRKFARIVKMESEREIEEREKQDGRRVGMEIEELATLHVAVVFRYEIS